MDRDCLRSAVKNFEDRRLAMSGLAETCVAWIFFKNRRNEGQWFENNPLELVFERENYNDFIWPERTKRNQKKNSLDSVIFSLYFLSCFNKEGSKKLKWRRVVSKC